MGRPNFLGRKERHMSNDKRKSNKSTDKAENAAVATATPTVEAAKPEAKAAKKKQPATPAEMLKAICQKYPNQKITDGSLLFDEKKQKFSVEITCQHAGCKEKRRVFTSDLFQVKLCAEHTKEARRKKRKGKRNAMKEALKAATPKA